jgi:hypothetical protein
MIGWQSLADVFPVALVEPDGLIVTTDGRYVRVLECAQVPNPISADETELARVERCYRDLASQIPDGQSLTILAQTDPIVDALTEDRARVEQACAQDRDHGNPELARARRRLLAGLERR